MPTTFKQAEGDVVSLVKRVIADHHPALKKAGVTIDVMMAYNEDGPAVALHGYTCAAVVRKISYKNRVKGFGDAEITIDADYWEDLNERQRIGLIDHELTHLEVVLDNANLPKKDRAGRPKLSMRLHDWQMGGFEDVARRHGKHAPEVMLAREFNAKFGQLCFEFSKPEAA